MLISCPTCQTAARTNAHYCSICGQPLFNPSLQIDENSSYQSILRETSYLEPEFRRQFDQALSCQSRVHYPAKVKPRSVALVVLMPIFTFGLYGLYWWWRSGQEIREALAGQEPNPPRDILLLFITGGFWRLVMHYNYAARIADLQERNNLSRHDYLKFICPILSLCWLGTLSIGLMQHQLNRVWEEQNNGN
jgi:hypothetical protein